MSEQTNALSGGGQAPFSQEAEEAVIGAVLVDPNVLLAIASFLRPEDFYFIRHAHIWQALLQLNARNEHIDLVTLSNELQAMGRLEEIGGQGHLMQLAFNVPTSMHAEVYGRIVERAAVRRRLLLAADEIRKLALDEQLAIETVTAEAEAKLFSVTDMQTRREITPMYEAISAYYDRVEQLLSGQQESLGLPTGFRELDKLLGGLQRSDLLIFAGRPGMGKCVAQGTLVPTEFGLLPIEAFKPTGIPGVPDDEGGIFYPLEIKVQTPNGMSSTSHFYDSGVKPTLRITTRTGYTLDGTFVHPVLVSRDEATEWVCLQDLAVGDCCVLLGDDGAFYTDEITTIEDAGLQYCYDLTVPDGHAFVANGFVCHNTSWMLSLALNAARAGGRILIFTMEMGVEQITQRFLSMETGINMQKLRLGQLEPHEYSRFMEAMGRLSNLQIFIDDTPALNPIQMRTKTRRVAHEFGLDLVIVDYLQLMNGGKSYESNRVQEISYISRALKELARELNVPLLSAAQLSRAVEQRHDKRPVLSDLRESGSIEQDSDVVMFLYRDVVYNEATEFPNQANIIVAKHRNGPTGQVDLYFEKSVTRFVDADSRTIDLREL